MDSINNIKKLIIFWIMSGKSKYNMFSLCLEIDSVYGCGTEQIVKAARLLQKDEVIIIDKEDNTLVVNVDLLLIDIFRRLSQHNIKVVNGIFIMDSSEFTIRKIDNLICSEICFDRREKIQLIISYYVPDCLLQIEFHQPPDSEVIELVKCFSKKIMPDNCILQGNDKNSPNLMSWCDDLAEIETSAYTLSRSNIYLKIKKYSTFYPSKIASTAYLQ